METENLNQPRINRLSYKILYLSEEEVVQIKGSIRLHEPEDYKEIADFFKFVQTECKGKLLKIDFKELDFLNSLGITLVSTFIINARKESRFQIEILGNKNIYWQSKSLYNFKRLWEEVTISF